MCVSVILTNSFIYQKNLFKSLVIKKEGYDVKSSMDHSVGGSYYMYVLVYWLHHQKKYMYKWSKALLFRPHRMRKKREWINRYETMSDFCYCQRAVPVSRNCEAALGIIDFSFADITEKSSLLSWKYMNTLQI